MRILFAYNVWSAKARLYARRNVEAGKRAGFDIIPFELTPKSLDSAYSWEMLDRLWKYRKIYTICQTHHKKLKALMAMHDELMRAAQDADVLWVYNGANFHPDWLRELPEDLLTVYCCFDDPESSARLSMPVAPYFDACLVGNIAAIPAYQGWGCKHVQWIPIFTQGGIANLSEEDFHAMPRDISLVFCGERQSPWRQKRLEALALAFPDGIYYGSGWKRGFYPEDVGELYRKAKLGLNLHNSTGPINIRLFELPAHGVMQICDNKCRLGHIFALESEVVGYDLFNEALDLIRHYMDHDEKRAAIAWNGYRRYWKDYAPEQIWKRAAAYFAEWRAAKKSRRLGRPKRFIEYSSVNTLKNMVKNRLPALKRIKKALAAVNSAPGAQRVDYEYYQTALSHISTPAYRPNKPTGAYNFEAKMARLKQGEFFEWPNMVALNWTIAAMAGQAKSIIEVGGGTGCFAYEAAVDPHRKILCLEADEGARNWASQHRARPNITYDNKELKNIPDMSFDLLVSIGVIEHIEDYNVFLEECSRVASRAILTSSNRFFVSNGLLSPQYPQHVQEWSAGEFYYVLKGYWNNVFLYSMPDPYIPLCTPCDINTTLSPVIAVCYANNNQVRP